PMERLGDTAIRAAAAASVALVALGLFVGWRGDAPRTATGPAAPASEPARILFVGDVMFDRTIRAVAARGGYSYPLSCVAGSLGSFDAVVGNLGGPITDHPSRSLGTVPGDPGSTSFTFDPRTASALAESGAWIAHLGNNHI